MGSAGSVVAYVDVRWLELPGEVFTGLREAIESIKALGYEDPPAADKNGPSGEEPSGQPSVDGGGVLTAVFNGALGLDELLNRHSSAGLLPPVDYKRIATIQPEAA